MSSLVDKLAAFREAAGSKGVRINVYPKDPGQPPRRLMERAVLYAAFAGSLSAAAVSLALRAPSPPPVDAPSRYPSGVLSNPSQAPPNQSPSPAQPDPWQTPEMQALRDRLNYVEVDFAGRRTLTLDGASRIALSKQAAANHSLHQQGLTWRDLYGVIHAETGWITRDGIGKNKVISSGLAQLEPATAKVLGVSDPNDPLQAVHAAAYLLKEAGAWSRAKVAHLKAPAKVKAAAARDGLSIYYNLSTRARSDWNGENTADLPVETQLHIRNTQQGAKLAANMELQAIRAETRLERAAAQPQDAPSRSRVVMAARLDGGPAAEDPLKPEEDGSSPAQFSAADGLDALRTVLEQPCARTLAPQTVVQYNSACMFASAQPRYPQALVSALPGAMLAGYFDHLPVVVGRMESVEAFALQISMPPSGTEPHDKADKPQATVINTIAMSTGLVEKLGHNPAALEFILAHEAGHISAHHRHIDGDVLGSGLSRELDADFAAFQYMSSQGHSHERIASGANEAFKALRDQPMLKVHPLLRQALDARQTEFAKHVTTAREVQADLNMSLRERVAQR